jgi:hypothetical protein
LACARQAAKPGYLSSKFLPLEPWMFHTRTWACREGAVRQERQGAVRQERQSDMFVPLDPWMFHTRTWACRQRGEARREREKRGEKKIRQGATQGAGAVPWMFHTHTWPCQQEGIERGEGEGSSQAGGSQTGHRSSAQAACARAQPSAEQLAPAPPLL